MKRLDTGEIFLGQNHTDMINKAIGAELKFTQLSGIPLDKFGATGVIAWFVYMDGTTHGYEDDWKWQNVLIDGGNIIRELNISTNKNALYGKKLEKGYCPYRLAFQIDPFETGSKYTCKFVGAFRLKNILKEDMSIIEYEKIADSVSIKSLYDGYTEKHLTKKDFLVEPSLLNTELKYMKFDKNVLIKLQNWGLKTVADLLELEIGIKGETAIAIKNALYDLLKK